MSARELAEEFTPTEAEIEWAHGRTQDEHHLLELVVWLKSYQRLGYFAKVEDVPARRHTLQAHPGRPDRLDVGQQRQPLLERAQRRRLRHVLQPAGEARVTDAADMRKVAEDKRLTLMVSLVHTAAAGVRDVVTARAVIALDRLGGLLRRQLHPPSLAEPTLTTRRFCEEFCEQPPARTRPPGTGLRSANHRHHRHTERVGARVPGDLAACFRLTLTR
ncbi:hypothetical protein ACFXJ8_35720 [Nonomuraea sp. NPDC059194]|uniref:hypothetical protein n=1 Tax=Nonomuraea sp. NPDC059194 TaxID=3346764 RepID=UPI0036A4FD1B